MELIAGEGFKQLLTLQKKLLKHYIDIEGLPNYPIDLTSKSGQKLIKDFAWRFVEELGEANEQLEFALKEVSTNHLSSAKEHIINYNIEIADAIHFYLEILIYSGIENDGCNLIMRKLLSELNLLNSYDEEIDIFKTLFKIGKFHNVRNDIIPRFAQFVIFNKMELGLNNYGARTLSQKGLIQHGQFFWEITQSLIKAMNLLKNRDWTQTERKFNDMKYYEAIIHSMFILFQYLDFAGFTELSLFNSYVYKNEVNQERISNKY